MSNKYNKIKQHTISYFNKNIILFWDKGTIILYFNTCDGINYMRWYVENI